MSIKQIQEAPQALLLENIHERAEKALQAAGLKIKRLDRAPHWKEILKNLSGVQVLCSRSRTQIGKELLLEAADLDCIGLFCIGTNQVDLETAGRLGIPVFNAPFSNTRSVAEMVIGFLIGLSRSLFDHSENMRKGQWNKFSKGCFELRGKSLGIVGYGNIGSQVSVLAEALGMRVLYYDIQSKLPMGNAKPLFSLKELLAKSDFVSLHVPETPQTKNLIGAKELGFMKSPSYLINTSRGSVLELNAALKALDSGTLAGLALDVFPKEPKSPKALFRHPLQGKKNVILSPHVGGSTEEAQISIGYEVSKSLKDFLFLGDSRTAVNFPQLALPSIPENTIRISNIHKNQPGALSQINQVISVAGLNIQTQYLATNEQIGFLVMDLNAERQRPRGSKKSEGKPKKKTEGKTEGNSGQKIETILQKISLLDVSIKTRPISV